MSDPDMPLPPAETVGSAIVRANFRATSDSELSPLMLKCDKCHSTHFELRGDQRGAVVCTGCRSIVRAKWQRKWGHEK